MYAPNGKYLGLIPPSRAAICVAFSGPGKKRLYIMALALRDAQGNDVKNAGHVYSILMISQGFKGRAK